MAVVTVVAIGLNLRLTQQLCDAPVANAVAVLQDAQTQAAVLITWDVRTGTLPLERLDVTPFNTEQALQLQVLSPGGHPQSLGMTRHQCVVQLTVAQPLRQVPTLAISAEPRGGSSNPQGPTGPVVFKGVLTDSTLQASRYGGRKTCRAI